MPKIKHSAFPQEGMWRVVWFGRLTSDEYGNISINTHFARLDKSLPSNRDHRVIRLPIGEIPRLHINAVIQDGTLDTDFQPEFRGWATRSRMVNLHDEYISFKKRSDTSFSGLIIPDEGGVQFLGRDGDALIAYFDFNEGDCPLAIPSIELFRFFYATSSKMAQIATNGELVSARNHLWKDEDIDPEKNASIVICKSMLDADVPMLACFAFDGYARLQARSMYLYSAPEGENRGILAARPPISEVVELTFISKVVEGEVGPIEVVSRILSCDWNPPYKHLIWRREHDSHEDQGDLDEESEEGTLPRKVPLPNDGDTYSLLDRPSSQSLLPKEVIEEELNRRFPRFEQTPVVRSSNPRRTGSNKQETKAVFVPVDEASTMDATNSEEKVNRAHIVRNNNGLQVEPIPTAEIPGDDYEDILKLLKIIGDLKLANVEFLELLSNYTVHDEVLFNVYPTQHDERQRAWLYSDEMMTKSRVILVARIRWEGRIRYVFELQRRALRKNSTLLVWQKESDNKPVAGYILHDICFEYAAAGAATLKSSDSLGVSWARKTHTPRLSELDTSEHERAAARLLERIFSARATDIQSARTGDLQPF